MGTVKVEIVNKSKNKLPEYQSSGAVGMDLFADSSSVLQPGDRVLMPTGIVIAVPEGYEGQIRTRSGRCNKEGLVVLNSPGTIDPDYRGEIGVILYNAGKKSITVNRGERIAQLVLSKVEHIDWVPVASLDPTERGTAGFGSSGK